jgi:hypothetical protein
VAGVCGALVWAYRVWEVLDGMDRDDTESLTRPPSVGIPTLSVVDNCAPGNCMDKDGADVCDSRRDSTSPRGKEESSIESSGGPLPSAGACNFIPCESARCVCWCANCRTLRMETSWSTSELGVSGAELSFGVDGLLVWVSAVQGVSKQGVTQALRPIVCM